MPKHQSKIEKLIDEFSHENIGQLDTYLRKICRECREHDIEAPVYDFDMTGLMLTFHANPAHLPAASQAKEQGEKLDKGMAGKTTVKTKVKILCDG